METDDTGCLILEPEVANQLQGLKESSGFETMGAFLLHLFDLEEQSRAQQCLRGLFHHIEQPWLSAYNQSDQELSTSIVRPPKSVSVGIQVELCCRKETCNDVILPMESLINQAVATLQDDLKVEIARNDLDNKSEDSEFSSGDEDQASAPGTCTPQEQEQPEQRIVVVEPTFETSQTPKFFTKRTRKPYQEKVPVRTCTECGATFTRKINYLNHMRSHDANEVPQSCQYCPSVFQNSFGRKIHISIKHPEHAKPPRDKPLSQPILCNICGRGLKSTETWNAHMRTHSTERPFQCSYCPKTFKHRTSRQYHERTHTKQNPFMCLLCNRSFRFSSSMSRHHMTVHLGQRPFKCSHCAKTFTAGGSLKAHINTQHLNPGVRPHLCPYCGKGYQKKDGMNSHIAKKHSNPNQVEEVKRKKAKRKKPQPKAKEPKAKEPKAKEPKPKEPKPMEPKPMEPKPQKPKVFPHVSMTNVVSRGHRSQSYHPKVTPLALMLHVTDPNPAESDDSSDGLSIMSMNDNVKVMQRESEEHSAQRQSEIELAEVMAVMLSS